MSCSGTTSARCGWGRRKSLRYRRNPRLRAARPAAGLQRELRHTTITTFGEDYAVCSTEFTRDGSERIGRQQQTWVRFPFGWRIVAAQVSLMS